MSTQLSAKAEEAICMVSDDAIVRRAPHMLAPGLLGILAKSEGGVAYRALTSCGLDTVCLDDWLRQNGSLAALEPTAPTFTDAIAYMVSEAGKTARNLGHRQVGTEHLLLAVLDNPVCVEALATCGLAVETIRDTVYQVMGELGLLLS